MRIVWSASDRAAAEGKRNQSTRDNTISKNVAVQGKQISADLTRFSISGFHKSIQHSAMLNMSKVLHTIRRCQKCTHTQRTLKKEFPSLIAANLQPQPRTPGLERASPLDESRLGCQCRVPSRRVQVGQRPCSSLEAAVCGFRQGSRARHPCCWSLGGARRATAGRVRHAACAR